MKEALFQSKIDGNVKCGLCNHHCILAKGNRGLCGVRENNEGVLYSLNYGRLIAEHAEPIEKKPLFHFQPGSLAYSISTVGCNFKCDFCQNWDISQSVKQNKEIPGRDVSPEETVEKALNQECASIAYTYTEPTIFYEYAYDTAKIASEKGLKNVFVSNGYTSIEALDMIKPYLDAGNVDLKSFNDGFYRKLCGARLEPVLETLKWYVRNKVWLEVTTLLIPGHNDSEEDLRGIAGFIKKELGDFVPWHVSRFTPHYKMQDVDATPIESIHLAVKIGKEEGLKYIYAGNIPHENSENTYCPKCKELVVERYGFAIQEDNLIENKCPKCDTIIEGVWQ